MKKEDEARYHLRAGMATVALQAKIEGKPAVDAAGRPLKYANRLANGVGMAELERWRNKRIRAYNYKKRENHSPIDSKTSRKVYMWDNRVKKMVQIA